MKNIYLLLFFVLFAFSAKSQNGAADFDGLTGSISVNNGSAMIANSTAMTIEGWVFPRNPAPNFPNFDGFFGWRNEFDADFYLLHLNSNSVEGRIRTNAGFFSVTDTGLRLNQWNHIALTYDGSMLRMYINGNAASTTTASGSITDTTETLYIGNLLFQGTNFYLDGRVDEFRVWRSARTLAQINALRFVEIVAPSAFPNLSGYYKLNDTIGSPIAKEEVAGRNGAVSNGVTFTTAGTPLFNGPIGYSNQNICDGDSIFIGGAWRKAAGTYRDTIMRAGMQDSLVFIELLVAQKPLIPGIVKSNWDSLSCNIVATSYTWFRDGFKLAETTQKIRFTTSGNYRVIAYNFQCPSDTSLAFNFQVSGLETFEQLNLMIYPNPANEAITILSNMNESLKVRLFNIAGVELYHSNFRNKQNIDLASFAAGIYILEITDEKGAISRKRLIKAR